MIGPLVNKQIQISGAGGSSGGGSGGISEDPDTLSSVSLAKFVDLISEGPIVGLVNNEFSIFLDGVPLKELEGTPNYRPFTYQTTLGTQSQLPIPGFTGTQQEIGVGLKVTKVGGRLIRSVLDSGAEAVRVTVSVNGLSRTTGEGKITGTTVQYNVYIRVVGGSWSNAVNGKITGKTGSKYQRSHEVRLSGLGVGPYEVAVERTTDDSASALIVDSLYWDTYNVINYEPFSYPNSALVALQLDARYFSQVPARAYHVKGLLIKVPRNYDPITRKYATTGPGTSGGGWDGTFQIAYSNNPAWCFYDLILSRRYGLGRRITSAQISKWNMYDIGQYCDGLVPTGNTSNIFESASNAGFDPNGDLSPAVPVQTQNMEPRFTLNMVINTKDDAYRVLNQLSSVFRGMSYWGAGGVNFTQDRPTAPSMIFANANVVNGMFNYEGSARSQRHTVCLVGWNDPSENFRQKFEYIEDKAGIDRYGINQTEVIAIGCTSRSQARRVGLWLLYTERYEKDAITFDVGIDAALVAPGAVIQIMDVDRTGARWGGRITTATTAGVTLDASVALDVGSYVLSVMAQDGSITTRLVNVLAASTFTDLIVSLPFSVVPADTSVWTLASTYVAPMLARVVLVKQNGDVGYSITALQHRPSKFAAIELGIGLAQTNYSFLTYNKTPVVTGLKAVEDTFKPAVTSPLQSNIDVSWDGINDVMVKGYKLKLVGALGSIVTVDTIKNPHYTFEGVVADTYTVSVWVVSRFDTIGAVSTTTVTVLGIDTVRPDNPTGFYHVFIPGGIQFQWDPCTNNDYKETEIRVAANPAGVYGLNTASWSGDDGLLSIRQVLLFRGKANKFVWLNPDFNTFDVAIKHRDNSDKYSAHDQTEVLTVTLDVAVVRSTSASSIGATVSGLTGTVITSPLTSVLTFTGVPGAAGSGPGAVKIVGKAYLRATSTNPGDGRGNGDARSFSLTSQLFIDGVAVPDAISKFSAWSMNVPGYVGPTVECTLPIVWQGNPADGNRNYQMQVSFFSSSTNAEVISQVSASYTVDYYLTAQQIRGGV